MKKKRKEDLKNRRYILIIVIILVGIILIWSRGFTGFIIGIDDLVMQVGQVFIGLNLFHVYIDSPLNITYNFNASAPIFVDLNVSSDRAVDTWWYDLVDMATNTTYNQSIIFTPNSTIYPIPESSMLIVYANDSAGNIVNSSVVFEINISNSAPIIENMDSEILVCELDFLSYIFNVTDVDGDTITPSMAPLYPITPFYIRRIADFNATRSRHEIYSGVLDKDDLGGVNNGSYIYAENISVSDGANADAAYINITVIEVNNDPEVENIGVKTVWLQGADHNFTYQISVNDTEDGNQDSGNLTFNVSFSNQTLFNISSAGVMNYTGNASDIGVHTVTICVTDNGIVNPHQNISWCGQDGSNITTCSNLSLTVTNVNRPPNITSYYPGNNATIFTQGLAQLYFNISKYDPDGTTPDAYWYVDGSLKEADTGNYSDEFLYSFACGISGSHTVVVVITDGLLTDSVQWNISVSEVECGVAGDGGGGGGGGGTLFYCDENWGCGEWETCRNLEQGYESKEVSFDINEIITERCELFNLDNELCGYQTRDCQELNHCWTRLNKPGVIRECRYTIKPTCEDRILNCHHGSCEVLTDCGGPCTPCPTCSDGILNQNEEDADCGGPCPPCPEERPLPPKVKRTLVYILILGFLIALLIIVILIILYYINKKRVSKFHQKVKAE